MDVRKYGPITLLSVVDKVFESMMSSQVANYIDCMFNPCISAYRKNHSCETTLLALTENWKQALDSNQYIGQTNMSKAFDSLHPSLIINKLKAYSVEQLSLMRSYFTNWRNRVKLNGIVSSWKDVNRGCPQGSSFGSLLWNIYQNDLTYLINNACLSMYADDHQLYVKGQTVKCVEKQLNEGDTSCRSGIKKISLKEITKNIM